MQDDKMSDSHFDWLALQRWYRSSIGQQCNAAETAILNSILPSLYGYVAVVLGTPAATDYLQASPVGQQIRLDRCRPLHNIEPHLLTNSDQLPLATDQIDLAVIPHSIEFTQQPLELLRELDRVLIPEGYVVFIAFNPFSCWSIFRLLKRWSLTFGRSQRRSEAATNWQSQPVSVTHLRFWLSEVGFEVLSVKNYRFANTLNQPWLFCGSGYVLLAKKKLSTLTLIKPRWRSSRTRIMATGLAERRVNKKHE